MSYSLNVSYTHKNISLNSDKFFLKGNNYRIITALTQQ